MNGRSRPCAERWCNGTEYHTGFGDVWSCVKCCERENKLFVHEDTPVTLEPEDLLRRHYPRATTIYRTGWRQYTVAIDGLDIVLDHDGIKKIAKHHGAWVSWPTVDVGPFDDTFIDG